MDNATVIAIVILIGVFVLMIVTIIKSGVDAAIKLWGVMGALTGVAFGAITSFYFTNKINRQEIQSAYLQKEKAVMALNDAAQKAEEANRFVNPLAQALKDGNMSASLFDSGKLSAGAKQKRLELADSAQKAAAQLSGINVLKEKIVRENKLMEIKESGKIIND